MASYVLEGPKWSSDTITWSFATSTYSQDSTDAYSSAITQGLYQAVIEQALARWQAVSGITFQQVPDSATASGAADIRFGFANLPITTNGEIGQTTYYYSGNTFMPDVVIQLEDPAYKALQTSSSGLIYSGTASTLYQVVLHEIGHALGMAHDLDTASIMYPVATATNRDLDATDIAGIQALYGAPAGATINQTVAQGPTTGNTTGTTQATTQTTSPPAGVLDLQGTQVQYAVAVASDGTVTIDNLVTGAAQTVSGITTLQFSNGVAMIDPNGTVEDVARIYKTAFGEDTDTNGISYWAQQLTAGAPEQSVIESFSQSPQFTAYQAMDPTTFVTTIYQQTFGRAPDAAGLSYWTGAIANGMDRSAILVSFSNSQELITDMLPTQGDTDNAEIYRLYTAAFGRTPDASGLDYWVGVLQSGTTATQIAQGFLASPEYQQTYGGLSNDGFINALYQNVLGRAADASGTAFWEAQMHSGATQAQVLLNFSDSPENRLNTAPATHANWSFFS